MSHLIFDSIIYVVSNGRIWFKSLYINYEAWYTRTQYARYAPFYFRSVPLDILINLLVPIFDSEWDSSNVRMSLQGILLTTNIYRK